MTYGKGEAFDQATYYDADDTAEHLSHETVEDALEAAVELVWEEDKTPEEVLDELCPITLHGYVRKKVSPSFAREVVDSWMDDFDEMYWMEEYGNFEDMSEPWKPAEEKALRDEITKVLQSYVEKAHVWQCDKSCDAVFTKEEVRKLIPGSLDW